jgi:hypothetical protein
MLSLKAKDITKSIVVAIVASLLCAYIFLPLSLVILLQPILAIDTAGMTHSHTKALLIIYGMGAADAIGFGVSGFLMGVLIGFASKNNRIFTTALALLIITIVFIICYLGIIPNIPHEYKSGVLIRLSIKFLLHMVCLGGCAFLGVWLVSRKNRKSSSQSLPGDVPKAVPPP